MTKLSSLALLGAVAGCSIASLAGEVVRGPVTGFILDGTARALRVIRGVPGGAVLSFAVPGSQPIRLAAFVPGKDVALIAPAGGASLVLARGISNGEPDVKDMDGVTSPPDNIAVSEDGGAALLYFLDGHRFQLVEALEGEPTFSGSVSAEQLPPLVRLALYSKDRALVVTKDGDGSRVWLLQFFPSDPVRMDVIPLGNFGSEVAVEFRDKESAFIADAEHSRLFLVRDLSGSREIRLIADARDGLRLPAAIRKAGASLLVANTGSNTIQVYDLEGGVLETVIETPISPTRLDRMMSRHLFALNQPDGAPLYLLDVLTRKVFFVPAERLSQ